MRENVIHISFKNNGTSSLTLCSSCLRALLQVNGNGFVYLILDCSSGGEGTESLSQEL